MVLVEDQTKDRTSQIYVQNKIEQSELTSIIRVVEVKVIRLTLALSGKTQPTQSFQ